MAQPVVTATDHRQTGELGQTDKQTDKHTDATKRIISPASRSIKITGQNLSKCWVDGPPSVLSK